MFFGLFGFGLTVLAMPFLLGFPLFPLRRVLGGFHPGPPKYMGDVCHTWFGCSLFARSLGFALSSNVIASAHSGFVLLLS